MQALINESCLMGVFSVCVPAFVSFSFYLGRKSLSDVPKHNHVLLYVSLEYNKRFVIQNVQWVFVAETDHLWRRMYSFLRLHGSSFCDLGILLWHHRRGICSHAIVFSLTESAAGYWAIRWLAFTCYISQVFIYIPFTTLPLVKSKNQGKCNEFV